MVMIVTLALANGFQEAVSQKIFSFWGHIRVQEKQPGKAIISEEIPLQDAVLANNCRLSRGKKYSSLCHRYALLKTKEDIEGVLVKGLEHTYDFEHLKQFIRQGQPINFKDSLFSRELLVSEYTATRLQIKPGDSLLIYFLKPGENPRTKKMFIAGIYKTGIEEYDRLFAIGDIRLIRNLNQWNDDQAGGYESSSTIKLMSIASLELDQFPATWDAISVKKISPNIFDWLNMQDVTRNVLISFMIAIAVINLVTCLLILVLERVRMIGILKSLGASDWTVQKIFLRHSMIITFTGIIIGTALALCLMDTANRFYQLKAYYYLRAAVKLYGGKWPGWSDPVDLLPGDVDPSILVRRIQPVKAIRFR
jgi:lipoprotein-releasing system permease protein